MGEKTKQRRGTVHGKELGAWVGTGPMAGHGTYQLGLQNTFGQQVRVSIVDPFLKMNAWVAEMLQVTL
jgi:hypothetical protein